MNVADKINHYEGMLRRIARMVDEADESDDADPWLVLEDIKIAAEDALSNGGTV